MWLRILLPMQGTRVPCPAREDPTGHGASKPVPTSTEPALWSPGAATMEVCALEPARHNERSPRGTTREARAVKSPCTTTAEKPAQQARPSTARNKWVSKNRRAWDLGRLLVTRAAGEDLWGIYICLWTFRLLSSMCAYENTWCQSKAPVGFWSIHMMPRQKYHGAM